MATSSVVTHIDEIIDENDITSGARKILTIVRPFWLEQDIEFKLLTDGITNKLVSCSHKESSEEDVVLVRVYGHKTDLMIDRNAETRNIILLHNFGLAPQLYATFVNGLAYEFVPGCTLSIETVRLPRIYKLVASSMAQLHKVSTATNEKSEPLLWKQLQKFINLIPEKLSDPDKQKRYDNLFPSKSSLEKEIDDLKTHLTELNSPIVFAHNDLLLGNVIFNEEKDSVTFIDYEYAGYNYQAFDIGNHFNEFAGVDPVDYSFYPDKDLQLLWINEYLKEYNDVHEVPKEEIMKLYIHVNKFSLSSHFLWVLWSIIQTEHSTIDFDFIGYGACRLNEYFKQKEVFLAL